MNQTTNNPHRRIPGPLKAIEKFSYGCGDLACNVAIGTLMGVITYFYTDYAGVAAGVVALILSISRIPDAFSDLILAVLMERTHRPEGKARVWIKWFMIPLMLSVIVMFLIPANASTFTKAAYIFIAYNLANTICYTCVNLSYSALSSLMTRDEQERTQLSSWRMGMSPLGRLIAVTLTMPLVKLLGDDQRAWIIVMTFWCVLAMIPLFLCYKNCKELEEFEQMQDLQQKAPLSQSIKTVLLNPYWWAVALLWGLTGGHYALIGGTLPYYCKYIFGNDGLYSPLYTMEVLLWCVMSFLTPYLTRKISKRNLCLYGSVITVVCQLILGMFWPTSLAGMFLVTILRTIATGPIMAVIFAMMADVVEWTQWKYHVREEGMVFAASGILFKAISAITTAILGFALDAAGYVESTGVLVQQPQAVLELIPNLYHYGIVIIYVLMFLVAMPWKIDKQYPQIMAELKERTERGEL